MTNSAESSSSFDLWPVRRIFLATATALGIGLLFLLLYQLYMIVFLFFVAISLQVAINPAVEWLRRRGIRRDVGVISIYTLLLGLITALLWFMGPLLIEQARLVQQQLPEYYQTIRTSMLESSSGLLRGLAQLLPARSAEVTTAALATAEVNAVENPVWTYLTVSANTLFAIIAVFILAYYWTLEGDVILRRLVLRAPIDHRDDLRTLIDEMQGKIGAYFRGQAILCVIIGVVSTLAYLLLGVPNALLLGLIMGIFEALPIIGPTLGAIPAVLLTLTTAPELVVWVIGSLVLIQALENNLLVPRVMDQSVGVNPVVTILAIAAFGVLFGITGAILAIPLAAVVQILVSRLLFQTPIADPTPAPTPTAPEMAGRTQVDVLRVRAQSVANAVRKQVRTAPQPALDPAVEQVEDQIEAFAVDLDQLLAKREPHREPNR
jgi:predicted PurR-regulated permease PerM